MKHRGKLCTMEGCHTITSDQSGLCDQCRLHVFDTINGLGRVDRKPTVVDKVWELLPGRSKFKETSFGFISSKSQLQHFLEISGVGE